MLTDSSNSCVINVHDDDIFVEGDRKDFMLLMIVTMTLVLTMRMAMTLVLTLIKLMSLVLKMMTIHNDVVDNGDND